MIETMKMLKRKCLKQYCEKERNKERERSKNVSSNTIHYDFFKVNKALVQYPNL